MMPAERFLVLGCGKLGWRELSSPGDLGRKARTGRLEERITIEASGPKYPSAPGDVWISLADELEGQAGWRPVPPLLDGKKGPEAQISSLEEESEPLVLPAWPELALGQAHWVTRRLGGPGVLVTPSDWTKPVRGRHLLEAWGGLGWNWASLEEVLRRAHAGEVRFAVVGRMWTRFTGPSGDMVVASGPEAALASEVAPLLLENLLAGTSPDVARLWREQEEALTGWIVRQRLTAAVREALQGRRRLEVGGSRRPMFLFSSSEAATRFRSLTQLRLEADLSSLRLPTRWWDLVGQGRLQGPQGETLDRFSWPEYRTLIVRCEETGARPSSVQVHLDGSRCRWKTEDPVHLTAALELGAPIRQTLHEQKTKEQIRTLRERYRAAYGHTPAPPPEMEAPSSSSEEGTQDDSMALLSASTPVLELPEEPAPEPEEEGDITEGTGDEAPSFEDFDPATFTLTLPHRPERVRVWIDDVEIPRESLHLRSASGDDAATYRIEGTPVPHGAIVRIDFDPSSEV